MIFFTFSTLISAIAATCKTAKKQPPEREIIYICDLGAKVGCERLSEHSTYSD